MAKKARVFSRKFKLAAVRRMLAGENVSLLAQELKVLRKDLYVWRDRFRSGGPEALRGRGRPPRVAGAAGREAAAPERPPPRDELAAAKRRIGELERKIGQQELELDFFQRALRQVSGKRRSSDGPGARSSTRSSKR